MSGIVMAPRGVGTMLSMLLVGRLVRVVDARYLVVAGLLLAGWSLHIMAGFSPQMNEAPIIIRGVIQGLGLGLVFVPLSTVAFATLAPSFRTDGTALFSLVRNLGSSIGISVVSTVLTRNVQVNHTELVGNITPFAPALKQLLPGAAAGDPATLTNVDGLVNQQALMISYIDDFKLMMIVCFAAIFLAFLLRSPKKAGKAEAPEEELSTAFE